MVLLPGDSGSGDGAASPRVWVGADYLLWWVKQGPSSFPLLTTSPPASRGVPGQPGTVVLFGGSGFDFGTFAGLKLSAGVSDSSGEFGLMGSAFLLEHRSTGVGATANLAGVPLLASPLVSPTTGQITSSIANNTNLTTSGFAGVATSRLWGGEANLIAPSLQNSVSTFRLLAGFRYLDLAEELDIENTLFQHVTGGNVVQGSTVVQLEGFHTRSQFYGGQVGVQGEFRYGSLFLNVLGKVALGVSHQVVTISGFETITAPNGVQSTEDAALLAMPTNNGRRTKDVFAVVPEVGVEVGYDVTRNVRLSVGYTFLYWNEVVRPADQIDPVVNTRFRAGVGPARPMPLFNATDFWAQGVNFGLGFRY